MALVPDHLIDPVAQADRLGRLWRGVRLVEQLVVLAWSTWTARLGDDAVRLRPHPYEFALYYDI